MRVNLEPDALCASAGVCAAGRAAAPPLPLLPPLPPQLAALLFPGGGGSALAPHRNNGPKDISCPLCMFVLTKIKDALSDPITREKVHDAGIKACQALPEGTGVRDACVDFVERNEAEIYDYVDSKEPAEICEKLSACPAPSSFSSMVMRGGGGVGAGATTNLAAVLTAALSPLHAAASSPSSSPRASAALARLSAPLSSLSDGNCDACMAVVKDLHSAVASPQLQDQATDMAKTACAALEKAGTADLAQKCREGVDQYAPLVFGMALAYLQPGTLCSQIGLCPAPSSSSSMMMRVTMTTTMPSSSGAGAVVGGERGGGLAGLAAVAEVVAREVEAAVREVEAVVERQLQLEEKAPPQQPQRQQERAQQQPAEEDVRVAVS
jgi:hypothetical protein